MTKILFGQKSLNFLLNVVLANNWPAFDEIVKAKPVNQ